MNLTTIDWALVGSVTTIIAFMYGFLRNIKSDIKEKMDNSSSRFIHEMAEVKLQMADGHNKTDRQLERVSDQIEDLRIGQTEILERLSFLEASHIYTMPIEPAQPNARSQAAREMWKRRKQKRIEK